MRPKLKLAFAVELQALGVDVTEAGFLAASAEDEKMVAAIAQNLRNVCV